jgi:hypothetical protein
MKDAASNYDILSARILQLRSDSFDQEQKLMNSIKQISYNANPLTIARSYLQDFIKMPDTNLLLNKAGLTAASRFIIGKLLGKYRSIGGFAASVVLEKLTSFIINKPTK